MNKIAQQWDTFNATVVPAGASAIQRQEMRRSFYAGAEAFLRITWELGGAEVNEDAAMAVMDGIHEEMKAFAALVADGKA